MFGGGRQWLEVMSKIHSTANENNNCLNLLTQLSTMASISHVTGFASVEMLYKKKMSFLQAAWALINISHWNGMRDTEDQGNTTSHHARAQMTIQW